MIKTYFGCVKIENISGGVVNFGNAKSIAPMDVSKENSGSGSGIIGAVVWTDTEVSIINSFDFDMVDQPTNQDS